MDFLRSYLLEIVLLLVVLVVAQFFAILSLNGRVQKLSRQLRRLLTGGSGEDLESLLHYAVEEGRRVGQRCDAIEVRLAQLIDTTQGCMQHVGMVRFDAFHDVSGQQSFSLAMLDGDLNGAIITALFGRQESRCFGKPVMAGKTNQPLSGEEERALKTALEDHPIAIEGSTNISRRARRQRRIQKQLEDLDDFDE
jgi:hypothetical protein